MEAHGDNQAPRQGGDLQWMEETLHKRTEAEAAFGFTFLTAAPFPWLLGCFMTRTVSTPSVLENP